ncbi:MAG: hypothetical protein AB7P07_15070 [Hyphomonadaceae bacterium]
MRAIAFAAALLCFAASAAAQTTTAPPEDDLARAARMLAANWRPIPGLATSGAEAAISQACEGAIEELARLDAALPEDLSAPAIQLVRAERGLVIVPTAEANAAYLFPNPQLPNVTSGLAAIRVLDPAAGRVTLTDAAGQDIQLQLGVAGGRAMMRILPAEGDPLVYVGCASTAG